MNTLDAANVIADKLSPDTSLVVSLGRTSEIAWRLFNSRGLFLDSMGDVAGVACGLALGLGNKFPVVAFDTDGGQLMGLHWLPTVAPISETLSNLLVVIFDNGIYESAGSTPSRYFELDWQSLGRAFQLDISVASTEAELKKHLLSAFTRFTCVAVA